MSYTVKKYGESFDAIAVLFRLPVHCDKAEKWHKGPSATRDSEDSDDNESDSPLLRHAPGQDGSNYKECHLAQ